MADNKPNRGAQDRARVSADERYEVDYFASKHALSRGDAERIIWQAGSSRSAADELVKALK